MNATMNHALKRTVIALTIGLALTFMSLPDASSHEVVYRTGFVDIRYGYSRTAFMPAWLRRDRDFRHWYAHSNYRFKRHVSWNRLYHRYLSDRRYYRHRYHVHYLYGDAAHVHYRKRRH